MTSLGEPIKTTKENKKSFYSKDDVVEKYDALRFDNPGGQYVHEGEARAFEVFLARTEKRSSIVDIPTGTGRMLPSIERFGFKKIVAADYSDAMLSFCQNKYANDNIEFSKEDIYDQSFDDASFDCVLSSRFLFHCENDDDVFSEFSRILRPKGVVIFDTLLWSPRTWTRFLSKKLGGKLYTHKESDIEKLARTHGFKVIGVEKILAMPSFFYNFIPDSILNQIILIENFWPKSVMTKQIWALQKNE